MELNLISLSLTSYALGLIHGLDSDHVIDVTDFVSQDPRPLQALLFGSKFGIGHTLTVFVVGLITFAMKSALPSAFDQGFQVLSGLLLIFLGMWGIHRRIIKPLRNKRGGGHSHRLVATKLDNKVFCYGPILTGIMTGMVGTAGVMVFGPVEVAPNIYYAGLFIGVYGFGVITSMCTYALVASKFFSRLIAGRSNEKLGKALAFVPAVFSIALGVVWVGRFVTGAVGLAKSLIG